MGECLPNHDNKVTLSKDKKDDWGIPSLEIDASFKENEMNMTKDFTKLYPAGTTVVLRLIKEISRGHLKILKYR